VPSKELWTVKIPKSVNAPARISRWNLWSSFSFLGDRKYMVIVLAYGTKERGGLCQDFYI
jgi:hypothetical protein